MSLKFNLLTKGLILVSIPLCFEITIFGVLLNLQNKVEHETERVRASKRISDKINTIFQQCYNIGHDVKAYTKLGALTRVMGPQIRDIHKTFAELKILLKDEPAKLNTIIASEQNIYAIERDARELIGKLMTVTPEDLPQLHSQYKRRLNADFENAVTHGMLKLAQDSELDAENDKTTLMRKQIRDLLKLALGLSVLFATSFAFVFSKNLSGRISRLTVNAEKLAKGEPLLPLIKNQDNDEIAKLDKTFHLASDLLNKAMQKEKAILKNAKDVIMAIDSGFSIVAINPAAAITFERREEELLGMRFPALFSSSEGEKATAYFSDIQKSDVAQPLEISLRTPTGEELTISLSGSYSDAEKTYYLVLHDVTSTKQIELIRREVTAMVTHDLKTPLQTISVYLQMLKVGKIGDLTDKGKKLLSNADSSVERMSQLISSVLDLEKIRSGSMELKLEEVDLKTFLPECAKVVEILANEKDILIAVGSVAARTIYADKHWLQQVLVNLLANAINYSPNNTTVTISCRNAENYSEILVCDEGPGISEEERLVIFERFMRLEKSAKEVAGSGLGLTFCKEMVALHRGYIRAEDNQPKGTRFVVGIPNFDEFST